MFNVIPDMFAQSWTQAITGVTQQKNILIAIIEAIP